MQNVRAKKHIPLNPASARRPGVDKYYVAGAIGKKRFYVLWDVVDHVDKVASALN
jgi:hypothetical protein